MVGGLAGSSSMLLALDDLNPDDVDLIEAMGGEVNSPRPRSRVLDGARPRRDTGGGPAAPRRRPRRSRRRGRSRRLSPSVGAADDPAEAATERRGVAVVQAIRLLDRRVTDRPLCSLRVACVLLMAVATALFTGGTRFAGGHHGHRSYRCAGGAIPSGTYSNMTVAGAFSVAEGAVNVTGSVNVRSGPRRAERTGNHHRGSRCDRRTRMDGGTWLPTTGVHRQLRAYLRGRSHGALDHRRRRQRHARRGSGDVPQRHQDPRQRHHPTSRGRSRTTRCEETS